MTIDQGAPRAESGVIGGSGLYALPDEVTGVRVDTPYGPPSDALFLGEVIEGPRFSTHAESRWFCVNGWSAAGTTGQPEAVPARELRLCCTLLASVADHDAGVGSGSGATRAVFAGNAERLRAVLFKALESLPAERDCVCSRALDGVTTGLPVVLGD